ncbi:hypothetical protein K493DRAFT_339415 [Basidiobolus meristosporus CBS 931.73]|uniref:FHA domain-containing protein n=1 Tax=Basidiobolus meristosporus CBS 931.73 TaxID=1314790 RepID=A0A1Y1Y051_9FUNG|nr:hypothetical protein K493DRAFT_339415 [Basidiobolus meristosporus CBS 931.73]|eukprot:ORX91348.1 hypothetical protein K493DRAFT_339415 [Basidiobolus meristosporus CBS 931.73]
MWILVGTGPNEGSQYWLAPGKIYTIGRKDCTINIPNDRSVSRKHATLSVSEGSLSAVNDTRTNTSVTLTDEGSKFGLFVNQEKIDKQVLREGDEIKLGAMSSTYKLTFKRLVLCCSGMRASIKKHLSVIALDLDVKLVDRWSSECTHLVMQNIQVTQKVLFALLRCCYIVNDKWLEAIHNSRHELEVNFSLPGEEQFLPPIKEKIIDPNTISFLPNERRRGLFKSKTFIVLSSSQLPKISEPVEIGEGETVYYEGGLSDLDSFVARYHGPTFVRPPENANGILVDHIVSLGYDLISEMDIGFAILHGTLDCFTKSKPKATVSASIKPSIESIEPQPKSAKTQSRLDSFLKPRTAVTLSPQSQSQSQPQPQSELFIKPKGPSPKRISARELSSSILSPRFGDKAQNSFQANDTASQSRLVDIPNTMEDSLDSSIKTEPVVEVFSYGVGASQNSSQRAQSVSPNTQGVSQLGRSISKPISARDFTLSFLKPKPPVKRQREKEELKQEESQNVTRQRYTIEKHSPDPASFPSEREQSDPPVHPSAEKDPEVKSEVMEVNSIRNMAQVEFEDLLVKRKPPTKKAAYSGPNFKRFTKGYYPERDRNTLPTVVELVLHEHSIGTGADEQWLQTQVKTSESLDDSDIFGLHDEIGKVNRKRKAGRR